MRILLVNPPGTRRFLRDYYCSTISKTGYLWHPIDLLIQSGFLDDQGTLFLLDAIAERLTFEKALQRVEETAPEVIFALVGAQSTAEDFKFLNEAQRRTKAAVAISGEIVLGPVEQLFEQAPWLDAVVRDFGSDVLRDWISAGAPRRRQIVLGEVQSSKLVVSRPALSYPLPRHDLFLSRRYRIPLSGGRLSASLLSSFGCPFRCTYCNSGADSIGYRQRDLDEVFAEIDALCGMREVRHLFIRDMIFTTPRDRCIAICKRLIALDGRFTFNCYSRPDTLDADVCEHLARAGCVAVHVGVESFQAELISSHNRQVRAGAVREAFDMLHRYGIRAGAHFVLGLPGQTPESILDTCNKAVELDPDYVSFNVFQQRHGSELARRNLGVTLDEKAVAKWKRSAELRFYLRPGYMLRTLGSVRSASEFRELVENAVHLLEGVVLGDVQHY